MKPTTRRRWVKQTLAIATTACLLSFTITYADHKPGHNPGGGGGGTTAPYTLVDLGGFTGGDLVQASAYDVNNPDANGNLMVVGMSFAPVPGLRVEHAALWDVTIDGQLLALTDLHPAGYESSRANKVNDAGAVLVGGYVWPGFLTLPGLGGGDGLPRGMNDGGDIVGSAPGTNGNDHGALWHVDQQGGVTGPVDLGAFLPRDINNNGLMAGSVGYAAAVAWFDELGDLQVYILGALDPQARNAEAVAVNDNGMVTGNSIDRLGYWEAFAWTLENGMTGLGKFGSPDSVATDINNNGQIVGWSNSDGRFSQVAFVWQDGQMFDLNEITDGAGGKNWIQIANGINDQGNIVGLLTKTKPISEQHAFVVVPNSP